MTTDAPVTADQVADSVLPLDAADIGKPASDVASVAHWRSATGGAFPAGQRKWLLSVHAHPMTPGTRVQVSICRIAGPVICQTVIDDANMRVFKASDRWPELAFGVIIFGDVAPIRWKSSAPVCLEATWMLPR